MDFTFTEEQQAAVEAARAVFGGVAPDGVPSPALTAGAVADDFDRALWAKLADADLLSLLLDSAYDGAGLDAIALCLVLREAAKVLARVPLLESSAAAATVQAYGGEELKAELLARAGRGEVVLTVAANGRTGHDPAELAVSARQDGDAWVLEGCRRRFHGRGTPTSPSYPRTRVVTGRFSRWCPGATKESSSVNRSPRPVNGSASCAWSPPGSPPGMSSTRTGRGSGCGSC